MEYVVLTELTLLRTIWRAALRKPVGLVATRSLVRGANTDHLDQIVSWLARRGRMTVLALDRPDLVHHRDAGDLMRLTDVFTESEAWLGRWLGFDTADARFGRYAQAFRHLCCNTAFRRFASAYMLHGFAEVALAPGVTLVGLDAFDLGFQKFRFGRSLTARCRASRMCGLALNGALAAGAMATTIWSILRAIRVRPPLTKDVFFGSEYTGARDMHLWEDVADSKDDVLVVARNPAHYRECLASFGGSWPLCRHDAGRFGIKDGLAALAEAVADMIGLIRHGYTLPSDFFRALIALPYRRMVYRSLLNCFRFRYFWGRDEYNPEHILRSQELRRVGGMSIGIMHGIPAVCTVMHQLRYLDFDLYYVNGTDQYDRIYRQTWPSHMRMRALGSHGATREIVRRLRMPGGHDIACYLSPSFHEDKIVDALRHIAWALPDRKLFINIKKRQYIRGTFAAAVDRLFKDAPPNLVLHEGDSYELLAHCGYVVNESSTLTAEALQFGRVGLILDLDKRFKAHYYRRFPEICVSSAEEAVARIREVEAGRWRQPPHLYGGLIEMAPRVFWDLIREDLGLLPRESCSVNRVSEAVT